MTTRPNREHVSVLDPRLELARQLTEEERVGLGDVNLPVVTIAIGEIDLEALLTRYAAFGATVLRGMVMGAHRVGKHTGIQLMGPGDLLVGRSDMWPGWLSNAETRATEPAQLALFGNELLAAAYRRPRLVQGLYACLGDQLQRLTAQLVICQLPRVDERVLAMMWLLAESWGQVTSTGVRLPLALTHETLGALIGARRPTVTLALRKLARQGSILHQDTGWLLLDGPPESSEQSPKILPPEHLGRPVPRWATPTVTPDPSVAYAELRDTVRRLREQHARDKEQSREQLERMRSARFRMNAARARISGEALSRRAPPSS